MNPRRPAAHVPPEKAFPRRVLGILPWRKWKLAKVELVRFPFWAFPWSGKGPGGAWAVDALDGNFRLLHPDALEDRPGDPPGTALELPFRIGEEEARELVRRNVPLHLPLLRRAGLDAPPPLEGRGIPLLYPFWVGYLERKGRIRPVLADAVTGAPGGPALARTFLKGISSSPTGPPPEGPSGSPSRGPAESPGGVPG